MSEAFTRKPVHPPVALRDVCVLLNRPAVPGEVTGVTLSSDGVQPGDLYAALPGARTHGARFAAEAIADVGARVGQPGVGHRLGGGGQRVQHAGLLARGEARLEVRVRREVDDGAADAAVLRMIGRQPRRGVRADAARADARATERDRQRVAEGTHHAQSGDGDLR